MKYKLYLMIISILFFFSKNHYTYTQAISIKKDVTIDSLTRIEIYYFHTTFRCYTCLRIEKLAKEAVEF